MDKAAWFGTLIPSMAMMTFILYMENTDRE